MRARIFWHGLRRPAVFLEIAGETVDELLQIPDNLAQNHRLISACLASGHSELIWAIELEKVLDHFIHAKCNGAGSSIVSRWHSPLTSRLPSAGSTGRRNTGVESLCWVFNLQGLSCSFV